MRLSLFTPLALVALTAACGGSEDADTALDGAPATMEVPDEPITVTGFAASEAVRHDPEADVYLVANINGEPTGRDDNGFISRVSPMGEILDLKWIDGAVGDFTLNAPKGMTIYDGMLYVVDIDHVRSFDLETGAHISDLAIEGAAFLNDIAVDSDGVLYFTDTGTNTLHRFDGSEAEVLASGEALGNPNGVDTNEDGVSVVIWDGGAKHVNPSTGVVTDLPAPEGARIDGIVLMQDGSYLASSWDLEAVVRVAADGTVTEVMGSVPTAADIGYDVGRHRVLIPTFDNVLHIIPLEGPR